MYSLEEKNKDMEENQKIMKKVNDKNWCCTTPQNRLNKKPDKNFADFLLESSSAFG